MKGHQLDYVVHRSLASFSRRNAEEMYSHLGEAGYLVSGYERGTAYHVYLGEDRGVVVMLEPDVAVTLPDFVETVREKATE